MQSISVWEAYGRTLQRELGDDLGTKFFQSLRESVEDNISVAEEKFRDVGRAWAPIIHHWGSWVLDVERRDLPTALILRDAKTIGSYRQARRWKQIYVNRKITGIADELSHDGEGECQPLLIPYLAEHGCDQEFTLVDSGCYGTVVLELSKLGVKTNPLFFWSKNPHIPGFLNTLGITEEEGTILNDSMECAFPHLIERPEKLLRLRNRIVPDIHQADPLSIRFGKAALLGLSIRMTEAGWGTAREEVQRLLARAEDAARGHFTGILSETSPEWSKKMEFLRNWPAHLSWRG
jgi:hypothetical protein